MKSQTQCRHLVVALVVGVCGLIYALSVRLDCQKEQTILAPVVRPARSGEEAESTYDTSSTGSVYADDAIKDWMDGRLTARQLHAALSLKDAIIPSVAACHWLNRTVRGLERRNGEPCFYLRAPIPVIGTTVVRNPQMVRRLVYSIDVPVQLIVIVHNIIPGDMGEKDAKEVAGVLEELQLTVGKEFIKVITTNCNRGCTGGWNSILHASSNAPWWLMACDDVAYKPGALAEISDFVQSEPDAALFQLSAFQTFILTRSGVKTVGVFDENIWPNYHEDCDYILRVQLSGMKHLTHGPPAFDIVHGDLDTGTSSTLTSSAHADYRDRNGCSHNNNAYYYSLKWNTSGECGSIEDHMFQTPFNNPSHTVASWRFDPLLRIRSESCWDPNTSPDSKLMERDYGRNVLVGDEIATAHAYAREVMSLWPEGSTPDGKSFDVTSRSFCTSPLAIH